MKSTTKLVAVLLVGGAAAAYYVLNQEPSFDSPPTMSPAGEATQDNGFVKRKTVDYEAIIRSVLVRKASFLTLTLLQDIVRDQHLETSLSYTPLPASRATVRVKYHVEYPIGYVLTPNNFSVSGDAAGLVITLHRPQLIARPSVRLKSYQVLDSGYLIDEKTALLKLQQRIQPETEGRAAQILRRHEIIPQSERALRGFLQPILAKQADRPGPPITFRYR
jgi:hypothetical protein